MSSYFTSSFTNLQIVCAFYVNNVENPKIFYLEASGRSNSVKRSFVRGTSDFSNNTPI